MASRRDASQRPRTISTKSANPPTRSNQLFNEDVAIIEPPRPSTSQDAPIRPSSPGDSHSNIRVFVRCRGRSAREKKEDSSAVVKVDASRREVTVPHSGVEKTYTFDGVFDPKSNQDSVYQSVAAPMLENVLLGYNCTLFAYGQTGTGKTHTMQGSLERLLSGALHPDAGMIPRMLTELFKHLQARCSEYTVQVTFVELYNEEFRNLLADNEGSSVAARQPMGKSRPGVPGNKSEKIEVVSDPSRGGIILRGVEPRSVKDAKHAIRLMEEGVQQRQVASTNLNERSSRSHSIFTVLVHAVTKDTTGSSGSQSSENRACVGKFNLVDLAGSEDINKSGAAGQQAREAGKINTSLLTLGKVIMALADTKGKDLPPYRDSKLTRLLQDSLGGNTKTSIIATVSPAESNLPETYSTLNYALRAKDIKNAPSMNQTVTREGQLQALNAKIACLEEDLRAMCRGDGWPVSMLTYDEMNAAKATVEKELAKVSEERADLQSDLDKEKTFKKDLEDVVDAQSEELQELKAELAATKAALRSTEVALADAKQELTDERRVKEEYRATEERNAAKAEKLRNIAERRLEENDGLLAKVERQDSERRRLVKSVQASIQSFSDATERIEMEYETWYDAQADMQRKTDDELEALRTMATTIFSSIESLVNERVGAWSEFEKGLADKGPTLADQVGPKLLAADEAIRRALEDGKTRCEAQCGLLLHQAQSSRAELRRAANSEITKLHALYQSTANEVMAHLTKEKELYESVKSETHRLLKGHADRAGKVQELHRQLLELAKSDVAEVGAFGDAQYKALEGATKRANKFTSSIPVKKEQAAALQQHATQKVDAFYETAEAAEKAVVENAAKGLGEQVAMVSQSIAGLRTGVEKDVDQERSRKKAKKTHVDAYSTDLSTSYITLRTTASTGKQSTVEKVNSALSKGAQLRQVSNSHRSNLHAHVAGAYKGVESLEEVSKRPVALTHQTPRKRKWEDIEEFERTRSREEILAAKVVSRPSHTIELMEELKKSTSSSATLASPVEEKEADLDVKKEDVAEEPPVPFEPRLPSLPMSTLSVPSLPVSAPTSRPTSIGAPKPRSVSGVSATSRPPSKMGSSKSVMRKPSGKAPLGEGANAGRRVR